MVVERPPVAEALRAELGVTTAGDILWTLNDPDLYMSLVDVRWWASVAFQTWLAGTMSTLLLDQRMLQASNRWRPQPH